MKKSMTVCKCPKCQNLVETEKKNEFGVRTCTNCGTKFRKLVTYKWQIINDEGT